MTDVTFTPNVTTIDAEWLQPINDFFNDVFDGATTKSAAADAINAVDGAQNVGGGTGEVFKGLSGATLDLKTILSGSGNVTVTNNTSDVSISVDAVTGGSNIGTGEDIFDSRSGDNLVFKNIKAGSQVTIVPSGDDLVISSSGTPTGGAANLTTFDDSNTVLNALDCQVALEQLSPVAWGVYNFDTDTITSGSGCTIIRSGAGTATLTLDTALSSASANLSLTNQTAGEIIFATTTVAVIGNLFGRSYIREGTIPNGSTTDTLMHTSGASLTMNSIQLTPKETMGNASYLYTSSVTSTNIIVGCDVDPGKDVDFVAHIHSGFIGTDVTDFQFVIYDTGI